MADWAATIAELVQWITPDGETYDLTTEADKGNWVLEASGWGLPGIDYKTQQGPYQHGVSVRDYRLQSRVVQLLIRQQACDRDAYWARRSQLLNQIRPNREPVALAGAWLARSQAVLNAQTDIWDLMAWQNELYGCTGPTARLFKWDGANQWSQVAGQAGAETDLLCMVTYDDGGASGVDLYCGSTPLGKLYRFDTNTLTEVCAQLNAQTHIYDMVVFDDGLGGGDQIFAGTGAGGRLFYYNVGVGWAQAAPQLVDAHIRSLIVYDDGGGDDLYGGTSNNGRLYRYNPAGAAWVQICNTLNAQTHIYSLCEYNGQLYAGTGPNGRLFRYDVGGGTWVQVAPQYGGLATEISKLVVFQGRLYGITGINGASSYLLRWNNVDAWELAAGSYATEQGHTLYVFNNRLFGGSNDNAYLLEYIRRSGATDLPCGTLRRVLSDGAIRDLCCYIQQGPQFTPNRQGWEEWSFQEVLRFIAADPIIYDPTEEDGPTYAMDPGATGAVNETQTETYEGTWPEHPTFLLTGPMNNPIIRNEDTDEFIELDYNIAAGRVVTITLTPGNQSVEDDLGANLIGTVTPESNFATFHLAPDPEVADGENDITIIAAGTNAATDFSFSYYNRYVGI